MSTEQTEPEALVELVRESGGNGVDRPRVEWIRGRCPQCGGDLVSNSYYVGGRGFLVVWECWESLKMEPTCDYRQVL